MAYGFNDDKSKQDVYSKSEIDSIISEIKLNASMNKALLTSWGQLKNDITAPANMPQSFQLYLSESQVEGIKNNFGNDVKIRPITFAGFSVTGVNPSTSTEVNNLYFTRLYLTNTASFIAPTANTMICEGTVYNPNNNSVKLRKDMLIVNFKYVVQNSQWDGNSL